MGQVAQGPLHRDAADGVLLGQRALQQQPISGHQSARFNLAADVLADLDVERKGVCPISLHSELLQTLAIWPRQRSLIPAFNVLYLVHYVKYP